MAPQELPDPSDCPTVNGVPVLGFGTWQNTDSDQCTQSVRTALETGYRHVDTAQIYDNEAAVGHGVAEATVDREDIFLATKIWTTNLASEDVKRTARESLDRLGVEYVDLLYVHWPAEAYDPEDTLPAFDELRDEGLIRNIGVSNFEPDQLETASEILDAPILANQVECHPMLPQRELREACARHDVLPVAYSPLARGGVFDQPVLSEIAERHDVSEAQVSLAWLRAHDVTAIPKATSEAHVVDNWRSLSLELSGTEVDRIDDIDERRREVDPDFGPWNRG